MFLKLRRLIFGGNNTEFSRRFGSSISAAARAKPGSLAHEPGLFEEAPPAPPRRRTPKQK